MEIERKFTLKRLPGDLDGYPVKLIEQGYLCTGPVLRIRKTEKAGKINFILCYKSTKGIGPDNKNKDLTSLQTVAKVNEEVELPLTRSAYEKLLKKVEGRVITKHRYLIPYGEYEIELDIFQGELKGLVFAEVEFPDTASADSFLPPDWFDKDVSNDKRYRNSYLAVCESLFF